MFDFGRNAPSWHLADGSSIASHSMVAEDGGILSARLATDFRVAIDGHRAYARRRLQASETAYAAVLWSDGRDPVDARAAEELLETTAAYWREWLGQIELPDHPWRSHLERSAIVLKGLTYAPTGATLRDSSFALWSLYTLGFGQEAEDYFEFVADVVEDGPLQVLYSVWGERDLPEIEHKNLSGYEGATPVRSGNAAASQFQLDMWGVVLDAIYLHVRSRDEFTERVWKLVCGLVPEALKHWRDPDYGIWEIRCEPRHFTSSKLMCWVAADRGAKLAERYGDAERAASWHRSAEEIKADICANGVNEHGVFMQAYGLDALDASLLLIPLVRFLPREDRRVHDTVLAVAEELTRDGLVLRYRADQAPDCLAGDEFTFSICSFWLVSALIEIGYAQRGRRLCEKLLSLAGGLGLYAEELDPETGRHWGNVPQAFTHLALIDAVAHVIRDDLKQPQHFGPLRD